ncbi:uncharacterized protein METZ01_LOCUS494902, partial [marine metagenome]
MSFTRISAMGMVGLLAFAPLLNAVEFGEPEKIVMSFSAFEGDTLSLKGIDARRQLVVTGTYSDGDERDLSRQVVYSTKPAGIVAIKKSGWVSPVKDGKTVITAKAAGGATTKAEITEEESGKIQPINFPNDITP